MAYVNQTPWHGIGAKMEAGKGIDEWRRAAGMDWFAEEGPVYIETPDCMLEIPNTKGLFRSDNKMVLATVSKNYKSFQPSEVLETFREYVEDLGMFEMETAGVLDEGRKVWALARSTDAGSDIDAGGGDRVNRYLLLATSFDRSLASIAMQTSVRVVCQNTLSAALGGQRGWVKIRHSAKVNAAVIKQRLMLNEQWAEFAGIVRKLSAIRVAEDKAREMLTVVAKDCLKPRTEDGLKDHVDELMGYYRTSPGAELASSKDTAWGLVNAVTFYTDHKATVRKENNSRRLEKAWFGTNAGMKAKITEMALALA
jgi:phage/plasmid-like protein (TIGR03299 family)